MSFRLGKDHGSSSPNLKLAVLEALEQNFFNIPFHR
jgi:hypothetical protein